ncbi:MAG: diadenylate cyclase [Flavobacteriaceae bacterium]
MNRFEFLEITLVDVFDIVLVAVLLFYLYRLVKGTVAINIFVGIVIIYVIWKLTDAMKMNVLSNILGNFISVGFFALIVVFQQEIRKFLLLIGSTNFATRRNVVRYFNFLDQRQGQKSKLNFTALINACLNMTKDRTGAIIVLERNTNLDFLKNTGEETHIELSQSILESIFFKNGPLHDGAILVKENTITATRVILPVSDTTDIPARFGLRHRAAIGVTEKTDAVVLVLSEQTGILSYIKDGNFVPFSNTSELVQLLKKDLLN